MFTMCSSFVDADCRSSPKRSVVRQGTARRDWDSYVDCKWPEFRPAGEALPRNWTTDMMEF